MLIERAVRTDDIFLNLASSTSAGSPLLFLHGVCRRWQDFVCLMPALDLRWQLHALDFRGHGTSDRCPGHYRVLDYAQDALAVVRTQFKEPVVLFGHSLGALVAATVAARQPDRVRAVILEDPPSYGFLQHIERTPYYIQFQAMRRLAGSRAPVGTIARELAAVEVATGEGGKPIRFGDVRDGTSVRFTARCLQDLDPDTLTPVLERHWLEGFDLDTLGKGVHCPALLLRGDVACGGMLPRPDAGHLAAQMADCTLVDLPGMGHLLHGQAPEQIARLVTGFLESL